MNLHEDNAMTSNPGNTKKKKNQGFRFTWFGLAVSVKITRRERRPVAVSGGFTPETGFAVASSSAIEEGIVPSGTRLKTARAPKRVRRMPFNSIFGGS